MLTDGAGAPSLAIAKGLGKVGATIVLTYIAPLGNTLSKFCIRPALQGECRRVIKHSTVNQATSTFARWLVVYPPRNMG